MECARGALGTTERTRGWEVLQTRAPVSYRHGAFCCWGAERGLTENAQTYQVLGRYNKGPQTAGNNRTVFSPFWRPEF